MADEETLTDEQAAEMERKLNAHRARQREIKNAQMREDAKPLLDLVGSDHFVAVQAAVPVLEGLLSKFPNLRPHIDAVRYGLKGLQDEAGRFPVAVASPAE